MILSTCQNNRFHMNLYNYLYNLRTPFHIPLNNFQSKDAHNHLNNSAYMCLYNLYIHPYTELYKILGIDPYILNYIRVHKNYRNSHYKLHRIHQNSQSHKSQSNPQNNFQNNCHYNSLV